ncbi:glycerophosphodiester phosphodiesterase family protein [uncultured Tateyamaria sp.]|uniref:glycerophosphodiester phosphodiesterase family protein n=1 Tax=uncultured Tateyamaria sp. TaxID=455651 RepID=UPI00261D4B0F|nr:glycerophosphodiester phosphodiesterase family protein [uncultured Tateyamaria sp.]
MKRILKWAAVVVLLAVAGLWVGNTSLFITDRAQHDTRLIAHRGVHQIYAGSDRSARSCQAAPVEPIEHGFIENTLLSMQEAFRLGADVVEIDVHLTQDNVFAVFHDWTLECRTNGTGVTHKQTFETLAGLDLGYRIDDGSGTFPLRGQGAGMMPSLPDVFDADMDGRFLINFKSRRAEDGLALAEMLETPSRRAQVYGVYGGAPPTYAAADAVPGLRGFDRASVKACLMGYIATGWTGRVPPPCHGSVVLVPQNYAPFLWGWPHRFTRRMAAAGADVVLIGDYDGSGFTSGVDTEAAFADVPADFDGYIWTNRIELIGPLLAKRP